MAELDKNRLRKLLFKFYQENDPLILQQGFDINGLVEFTMEKGVGVLNRMLKKKYNKVIDVNEDMGSAKQNFNRLSQGLTASTYIIGKEQEYREKLHKFFQKHDQNMISAARQQQFEKFIKFAMLNGLDKLSEKLRQKYGEGVDASPGAEVEQEAVQVDQNVFGNTGKNPFKLDVNRLRDDLEYFYTQMEDVEQLEVLDETTDWACEIGIEELDKNLEQLYGTSLNNFLESVGKELHKNFIEPKNEPALPAREIPPTPDFDEGGEFEIVQETIEVPAPVREFEEMSDEEILAELEQFYRTYDPENLENLEKVLELSRRIGRAALNNHLHQIYEDTLSPVPATITQVVEKRVKKVGDARPLPPMPGDDVPPPIPTFKPPTDGPTFRPPSDGPTFRPPNGGFSPTPAVKELEVYEEEEDVPEFLKMWKGMNKRINDGKARVRDADGNVMEVNILIDVCKNYTLDPITGICKTCGFAKNDHAWLSKKKGRKRR